MTASEALCFVTGVLVGAILGGIIVAKLLYPTLKTPNIAWPTPHITFSDINRTCHGYRMRSDNFVGAAGILWLCDDGAVIPEHTGVKFP